MAVSRRGKIEISAAGAVLLVIILIAVGNNSGSSGSSGSASIPGVGSASCKIAWTNTGEQLPSGNWGTWATKSEADNWANQNSVPGIYVVPVFALTITASQTVNILDATVVFYNGSGTELSSTTPNIGQTLTSGQSYTQNVVSTGGGDQAPNGAVTCTVTQVDTD